MKNNVAGDFSRPADISGRVDPEIHFLWMIVLFLPIVRCSTIFALNKINGLKMAW